MFKIIQPYTAIRIIHISQDIPSISEEQRDNELAKLIESALLEASGDGRDVSEMFTDMHG